MIGNTLNHYKIERKLGQGGMGAVYQAKDSKLGRDVALKILPDDVAGDPERLARFGREARLLASLNHSNIGSIYGLEESNGTTFLVLEFVDGEDLAERLVRGPLPMDEALEIARQIADALDIAHEHGIIHRDLKPGNIRLTKSRSVKVLDFGLGKALDADAETADLSQSPTLMTGAGTSHGVILGTAGYMSPEQARGRAVDRRADVWAFGCVLFEMLTGQQLFKGETVSDTLAAVLRADPDWQKLPAETPASIRRLLKRCLEKEPKRRLHHMADARIEIEDALSSSPDGTHELQGQSTAGRRSGLKPQLVIPLIAAAALVGMAIGFVIDRGSPENEPIVQRLGIQVSPMARRFGGVAISPDGKYIVMRGGDSDSRWSLLLRPLDSYEVGLVAGSAEGEYPFFSPDGQWVAFFNGTVLTRSRIAGGSVQKICDAVGTQDGTWGDDGTIVFSAISPNKRRSLYRVRAAGGLPELISEPDLDAGERAYTHPSFVHGRNALLIAIETAGDSRIASLDLDTGEKKILADRGTHPLHTTSGHALYISEAGAQLMAAPLNPKTLELESPPIAVLQDAVQPGEYDVSHEGTLAYFSVEGLLVNNVVTLIDEDGKEKVLIDQPDTWAQPRMSKDGKHVVVRKLAPDCVLWSFDVERKTMTRLTFQGDCHDPVWSPDNRHITFSYEEGLIRTIYEMPLDGSNDKVMFMEAAGPQSPGSWTADGNMLVYSERDPLTDSDIWVYHRDTDKSEVFIKTEFIEALATFSADGRYIAYVSNESGRDEVYVRPYPGPGGKVQISRNGGTSPRWSPVEGQLFFVSHGQLMVVDVESSDTFGAGTPRVFFKGRADFAATELALRTFLLNRDTNFDVTPDGKHVLVVQQQGDQVAMDEMRVIVNWFEELERVAPAN